MKPTEVFLTNYDHTQQQYFFDKLDFFSADTTQVGLETRSMPHATATKPEQQAVNVFGLGFVT